MKHIRFVWSDDLHRLVKRTAADRGVTITALVQDALRRECTSAQANVPEVPKVRNVLPESPEVAMSTYRGPIPKPGNIKR
jgi:hypothetical protein